MANRENYVFVSDENYAGLNPVEFGFQDCLPHHHYGPAVRTYWLIHYVTSGKGIFQIDGRSYCVTKGNMFVIPPYVQTYYEADGADPWSYIWIGFTCSGELPVEMTHVHACDPAGGIFRDMMKCVSYTNGRSAYLCAKLWELFALLREDIKQEEDPVQKVLFMIHTEYMRELNVQAIAQELNLDRSYFSAVFKKKVGMSPGKYLTHYRMKQAANLLTEHGFSVTVTAKSVGYTDVFTFSKVFKRFYGCSPMAYGKTYENKKEG